MAASTTTASAPARRPRVFYGWWIVVGALIAQFVAVGTQAPVAGAFLVPMTEELGWGRGEFAIATSVGTFVSALIGFFIGGYVDRYGARPLMVIGVTIMGGTLMAISRVDELWQFVLLRGVVFTVGFVLIGNLVVNVTLSKWFVRRRGWAISLASVGVSLGAVVITPIMVRLVDEIGWRDSWLVMGGAAWALVYPTALIMRRQPEDHGLLPDGAQADALKDAGMIEEARLDFINSYTRREAVRTAAMWSLVVAFGFGLVGLISMLFHAIPFMTDSGLSRSEASLIFSLQGVSALLSKFVWGWWMQRFYPRGLAALSFVISGAGGLLMIPAGEAGSVPLMILAFLIFGWGIGGMIPLQEFIWASFFGRRHLGAVRSAAMPASIIFAAGGPIFAGVWNDVVGDYNGAILTFVGMWAVAAVLVMLARAPTRSNAPVPVPVDIPPTPTPASRLAALVADREPPPPPAAEAEPGTDEAAVEAVAATPEPAPRHRDSDAAHRPRRDYGLEANGASGEPPASATPRLSLPSRTTPTKPALDLASLDRALAAQRASTNGASHDDDAGDEAYADSGDGASFEAYEPPLPVGVSAPAPPDGGRVGDAAGAGSAFIAFDAPRRRPRTVRFDHAPLFDLRELERVPPAEPVFERTPEPPRPEPPIPHAATDQRAADAATPEEVVAGEAMADPFLDGAPTSQPHAHVRDEPPRPQPRSVEPRRPEPRRPQGPPRPPRPPSGALEVSLGSAARAIQRSLAGERGAGRDILPAVAAGVATSAVTIGVVMLFRRGR